MIPSALIGVHRRFLFLIPIRRSEDITNRDVMAGLILSRFDLVSAAVRFERILVGRCLDAKSRSLSRARSQVQHLGSFDRRCLAATQRQRQTRLRAGESGGTFARDDHIGLRNNWDIFDCQSAKPFLRKEPREWVKRPSPRQCSPKLVAAAGPGKKWVAVLNRLYRNLSFPGRVVKAGGHFLIRYCDNTTFVSDVARAAAITNYR